MEIKSNGNTKITFCITELIRWLINVAVIIGTAVGLYYNLTNELRIIKIDIENARKEINEIKSDFKTHLREK